MAVAAQPIGDIPVGSIRFFRALERLWQRLQGCRSSAILVAVMALLAAGSVGVAGIFGGFSPVGLVLALILAPVTAGLAVLYLCHEWQQRPSPRRTTRREGQVAWIRFLIVLIVLRVLLNAYNGLDDLLGAFHEPGRLANDSAAAADLSAPQDRADHIKNAVCTWIDYAKGPGVCPRTDLSGPIEPAASPRKPKVGDSRTVLGWELGVVDSIFIIPCYILLAALLARLARAAIQDPPRDGNQPPGDLFLAGKLALILILVAACGDWVENALAIALTSDLWNAWDPSRAGPSLYCWQAGATSSCQEATVTVLTVVSLLKVLGIAGVAVYGLVVLLHWLRSPGGPNRQQPGLRGDQLAHALSTLRLHLVLFVAFIAALFWQRPGCGAHAAVDRRGPGCGLERSHHAVVQRWDGADGLVAARRERPE